MTVGIVVVIVIVAFVVILVLARRSNESAPVAPAPAPAASRSPGDDLASFHLEPVDFTVEGDTAVVTFDVDLPPEGADPVMADLLVNQAIEALRDREARGLPVEGVTSVRVMTTSGDEDWVRRPYSCSNERARRASASAGTSPREPLRDCAVHALR